MGFLVGEGDSVQTIPNIARDLGVVIQHRRRRLATALRARLPEPVGGHRGDRRADARGLVRRRYEYLMSRLARLHRKPLIYRLAEIRRIDREDTSAETPGGFLESDRPVWELTLDGPAGVVHETGDTLLVQWTNPPDLVDAVLQLLGEDGRRRYTFLTHSSVFQPGRIRWLPIRRILEEHLELYTATPALLEALGLPAGTQTGTAGFGQALPGRGVALIEALRDACAIPDLVRLLLRHQGRITARAYSLSDIRQDPGGERLQILVSAATIPLRRADGTLTITDGRATAYFLRRWRTQQEDPGDPAARGVLSAWPLRHPWRLSRFTATGNQPLIVIVTGTGIAGVLCRLRELRSHRQVPKEPIWLIYGVRSWNERGLYPEELVTHQQEGRIARMDIAESRPAAGTRQRVTEVVEREAEEIARRLSGGADVYVSGSRAMGTAIRNRLVTILVAYGFAADSSGARALLIRWEQEGRVQFSVS